MKCYVHKSVVLLKDGSFMLIEHFNHEEVDGVARAKAGEELERLGYKDYKIIESKEVDKMTYVLIKSDVINANLVGNDGTTE